MITISRGCQRNHGDITGGLFMEYPVLKAYFDELDASRGRVEPEIDCRVTAGLEPSNCVFRSHKIHESLVGQRVGRKDHKERCSCKPDFVLLVAHAQEGDAFSDLIRNTH